MHVAENTNVAAAGSETLGLESGRRSFFSFFLLFSACSCALLPDSYRDAATVDTQSPRKPAKAFDIYSRMRDGLCAKGHDEQALNKHDEAFNQHTTRQAY